MKIGNLPRSITAIKADWLPGVDWLGFTPIGISPKAVAQCESAIKRQANGGYILEYVTVDFGEPNTGFENDKRVIADRELHHAHAGRLVAVHLMDSKAENLENIVGREEFGYLQNVWAKKDRRYRWAVAFRILESYSIVGTPRADLVFDAESLQRWRNHPSGTLRVINDADRKAISTLSIERKSVKLNWSIIDRDFSMAEMSQIDTRIQNDINRDMNLSAMEGLTEEQKRKIRRRNAWLAHIFARNRQKSGNLKCDDCGFDPVTKIAGEPIRPRSLLDVHHKNPLEAGERLTVITTDFELLCPTCHRLAHARLRILGNG